MRIPGAKTARIFSRWLQARTLGGALILGYHRVARSALDLYGVCVTPEHFAEHLAALRKWTNPIRLSTLVQHLKEGSLPPRSVAVTFDDGYADNLYHAKPLLEAYEIPATMFVSTGYDGREFWWDELNRLVLTSQADPRELHLEAPNINFPRTRRVLRTETEHPDEASTRSHFSQELYNFLLPLDVDDLHFAMDAVRTWSGLIPPIEANSRALSMEELLTLAGHELIEIGSHTRNHLFLQRLTPERQREEIVAGKQDLETLLGRPVAGFSYPNGRSTVETRQIVRDAGFGYACTSLHNVVRPGVDLYDLTRFWQQDVEGDKFISGLTLWMKTR